MSAKVQPPPRWIRANQETCTELPQSPGTVGTVKFVCGLQALSAPGPSGGTRTPATGSSGESWPYTPSSLSSHTVRFTPVCGTRQDTLRYAVHTASAPREPGAWGLRASRKHHANNREKPQPPRHKTPAPGGGPMARALCGSRGPLARAFPALGRTPARPRCAPGGEGPGRGRRARELGRSPEARSVQQSGCGRFSSSRLRSFSATAAAASGSGALARSSAQTTGGRGGWEGGKDTAGSAS